MNLKTNLLVAAVTALAIVALEVVLNGRGIPLNGGYQLLAFALLLCGIVAGGFFYARENNREATFNQCFFNGFRLMALTLLLLLVCRLAAFQVFPSLKVALLAGMRHSMELEKMPAADIQRNINSAGSNIALGLIGGTVFLYAVPGILSVLLASVIFAKRNG